MRIHKGQAMKKNRKSKRHAPLARLLKILKYLVDHRFGGSLEELAEEAGITQRQTRRYISIINDCGLKVENVNRHGDGPRFRLVNPSKTVLVFRDVRLGHIGTVGRT